MVVSIVVSNHWPVHGGLKLANWDSAIKALALCYTKAICCRSFPCLTAFRLNYKLHAMVTIKLRSSMSTCWINFKCQIISTNSLKWAPRLSKGIPENYHTSRAFSQFQNTWPLVSASSPWASQVKLSMTYGWRRLAFVGRIFLQAHHVKAIILLGTRILQTVF